MDFRRLRYFVAVASELNFSRAAKRLHISQPPLTRQIRQLEIDLGVTLFERTPKGARLTVAGATLFEEASNLLSLAARAEQRVQQAGRGELGRLDIGIFGSSMLDLVPKLLMAFRRSYPAVQTVLYTLDRNQQIAALREHRISVGFNRLVGREDDIATELVLSETLFIALHSANPLARHKKLQLLQMRDQPMLLFPAAPRPNFVDHVIGLCVSEGFVPQIAEINDDVVTSMALVSGGFGWSIVTASTLNLRLPGVVYRQIHRTPAPTVDLSCLYRKNDETPALQTFLHVVREFRR
jgi:LysR family transcriptional regulator, benzoate and cis,cis-muconate-responsive activator of ben and cat genes